MSVDPTESAQVLMQSAVLRPFPLLDTPPLSSLSEDERLELTIRNLESHYSKVKAILLSQSITTISSLPDPATAPTTTTIPTLDPRLANRPSSSIPPPATSDSHANDALLASLHAPHNPTMRRVAKHDPTAPLTPSGQYAASGKFGVLAERLRLLGDYERESRRVVEGLRREGKKRKEMERLEGVAREKEAGMEKRERTESGNYDRARDPRLRA